MVFMALLYQHYLDLIANMMIIYMIMMLFDTFCRHSKCRASHAKQQVPQDRRTPGHC